MPSSITPQTINFLRVLSVAQKHEIKPILCKASKKELEAIFEIIINYLAGNLPEEEIFKRRHSLLQTLADKKFPLSRKRLILCQSVQYRNVIHKLVQLWRQST
jgi:hypothetical protein